MAYVSSPFPSRAEMMYIRHIDSLESQIDALEAERDALRADAERWKWAKQQGSIQDAIDSLVGDTVAIPEMEAAIDTAIAADGAQS